MPGRVTYSRSLTIIPTYRCHLRCQYCSFWSATDGVLPEAAADAMLQGALADGCREILIMTGEQPWLEPAFPLDEDAFFAYLEVLCRRALRLGLLPHTNVGVFAPRHLPGLQRVNASMGLMLESVNDRLAVHRYRGKRVADRVAFIEACGELRIPFTSGLLVGIGESDDDRRATLEALWERHARYGHLQEIIVQNFRRRPGTPRANAAEPSGELMVETVRLARRLLPGIGIQIPPNLNDHYLDLVRAGADDFGGVSADIDHINPEHRWPEPERLARELAAIGYELRERLPVYAATTGRLDPVANELRNLLVGSPRVIRSAAVWLSSDDRGSPSEDRGSTGGSSRFSILDPRSAEQVVVAGDASLTLGDWLAGIARVRAAYPSVPVVALSPDEFRRLSRDAGATIAAVVAELAKAGLTHVGGDERLLGENAETAAWLAVVRSAASAGLRVRAVLPLRAADDWPARVDHLDVVRRLQLETTCFDALEVRPEAGIDPALTLHAVAYARLHAGRELPHVRLDWASGGPELALAALGHGADQLGPTRVPLAGRTVAFPERVLEAGDVRAYAGASDSLSPSCPHTRTPDARDRLMADGRWLRAT